MAKIPFNIKFRPQIESGEYKVETRDGRPARIICWDANCYTPIVFLATEHDDIDDNDKEYPYSCNNFGRSFSVDSPNDLLIITPEPELSEFEKAIKDLVLAIDEGELQELGVFEEKNLGAWAIKKARELLILARDQFIKDGYVIEKKAFHNAVEKTDDKHKAEMSIEYSLHCKIEHGTRHAIMNWSEFQKVAQKFIDIGKAEALKDFPMWRKWENGACGNGKEVPVAIVKRESGGYDLVDALGIQGEKYIMLSDLEKLPGFKENEK